MMLFLRSAYEYHSAGALRSEAPAAAAAVVAATAAVAAAAAATAAWRN